MSSQQRKSRLIVTLICVSALLASVSQGQQQMRNLQEDEEVGFAAQLAKAKPEKVFPPVSILYHR